MNTNAGQTKTRKLSPMPTRREKLTGRRHVEHPPCCQGTAGPTASSHFFRLPGVRIHREGSFDEYERRANEDPQALPVQRKPIKRDDCLTTVYFRGERGLRNLLALYSLCVVQKRTLKLIDDLVRLPIEIHSRSAYAVKYDPSISYKVLPRSLRRSSLSRCARTTRRAVMIVIGLRDNMTSSPTERLKPSHASLVITNFARQIDYYTR